jgi:3D-(3,5/4)-trihydroxycyclohexane-1,2-dione acylhydrolase (decyclizing)
LIENIKQSGAGKSDHASDWFKSCSAKKDEWIAFKQARFEKERIFDPVWNKDVMTQPAAIKAASDWAREHGCISIFDAGDVQANGFQIVEDEKIGQSYTDGGASFMGFAASAVLAAGLNGNAFYPLAFSGDGSFMMNPQILIDAVEHQAHGCILILDNRRMSAISSLQMDQYGVDFATNDSVEIDYVAIATAVKGVLGLHGGYNRADLLSALDKAKNYAGLSVIHLPVYYGSDEMGGLGAFGRWNVGVWSEKTQKLRHELGL